MDLASKYRPREFSDVTGQEVVTDILMNICNQPELPHRNFLFIGPAGTGKTTSARIVNNILNNGESEPIEIDAASNSGVESVREIITQMKSYPLNGRYKVFIIDECHSLSNQAWQALLKTLEEPPAKTVTCLCTTNPEKIPDTILSRVQTFQLSKISLEGIYNRLIYILEEEKKENPNIAYETDAVLFISKLAEGGMRDSITLLSKVLAFSNEVSMKTVESSLSLANYDDYFLLLNSLVKSDNEKIVEIIDRVYNSGVNFTKWFQGFHSFLCNIIKFICLGDINKTMIPPTYEDKISNYSSDHMIACLRLANKVLDLNRDLKNTQYLQETAITYLCSIPKKVKK